jgi:5'(3')-deoxyribonucleotidase
LRPYALYIKKEIDKDCNYYRYISVINSVGRVLSRLIKKIEVMIKAEISEEDMEFTAGKSA